MIDIVEIKNADYLKFYIEDSFVYCENTKTEEKVIVAEFKELQQENKQLKEDIKNIISIFNRNCDDLEVTEEEFDSLDRWQELEQGSDSDE